MEQRVFVPDEFAMTTGKSRARRDTAGDFRLTTLEVAEIKAFFAKVAA